MAEFLGDGDSDGEQEALFRVWMNQVNNEIKDRAAGLSAEDLPDYDYRDAFNAGADAADIAYEVLKAAGWAEPDE